MLLLSAPDKSRYLFYEKPAKRIVHFSFIHEVPQMTPTKEKELAEVLAREHFLYIEEKIRKFWDDINGINA